MHKELRVAAYAVCVREDRILLARWVPRDGAPQWILPGGGVEHGEHPYDAVIREVEEETGYAIHVEGLLGVDSVRREIPRRLGAVADHHAVRVLYDGRITGGELRPEVGGSTDLAAWHSLDEVEGLRRVPLVDTGLSLWRTRPPHGRADLATH